MQIEVTRRVTVNVAAVRVSVPVSYDEDDMPNDYPGRNGDTWAVTFDAETGQIRNWPVGVAPRSLHMKVVDGGSYYLVGDEGEEVAKVEGNYVPSGFPGEHYGDYLIFNIDGSGRITNWKFDADGFFPDDE